MADYLLLIPLVAALAIGWALGRRDWRKQKQSEYRPRKDDEYFIGLNYLVDNKTDEAIDSFIHALKCNSETVPIRLALGTLFRRRGEIQRSIQLHQEVMAQPSLSPNEYVQVQLALSKDYLAAGLLDRAEALLLDVYDQGGKEPRELAVRLLIDIYQQEKDWGKALAIAKGLGSKVKEFAVPLAHFYCEQACADIERKEWREARKNLRQALNYDNFCVRASLLNASVDMEEGRWKAAIRHLRHVQDQDPAFVSQAVPLMAECFRHLGAQGELVSFLESSMRTAPSTTSMLLMAEEIAREKGDYPAGAYITEQLKRRPSIKGFNRLIDLHLKYASDSAKESLNVLRGLTGQLEQSKPAFCCQKCGFSGRTLHWQCPSCKEWGQVKPIRGLEGE